MHALSRLARGRSFLWDTLALGVVAAFLRLWGIGFDLPNLYHRDEARYATIPLQIIKSGDYNPHFFNYPSLFFYLLAMVYVAYFLFMASRGRIGNLSGLRLPEQVLENVVGRATMPSQFLVGRGMVALCGVLTVLLAYWLARQAYGRRAGFLSGLLLSLSPTLVRNSHFIAPDVTMALVSTASLCFSYQVLTGGRRQDYLLAGLLAGLAASTKYNAYAVLLPVLVAHILRRGTRAMVNTDVLLAGLACSAGFVIGTPFALLDLPAFLNGVAFELRHYAVMGDPGTEGKNAWLWYGSYLLRTEGIMSLLAIGEGIRGLRERQRQTWLFMSFPLFYLLLVSTYAVKNDRTVLGVVPIVAILAGAFLDRAIDFLHAQASGIGQVSRAGSVLSAMLVLAVVLWPARKAVEVDLRFAQDDVRTRVTVWMESHLPPGSRIVGEYYSPLLTQSGQDFRWMDRAIDQPMDWYRENADYVVFVENRYGGFYLDPGRYPAEIAAYEAMFTRFALVKAFQGGALGNPCQALLYKVQP